MAEKTLSEILEKLRKDRGLSQAKMAEVCSLALRYYQSLELGEQDNPGFTIIKGIINGLNIDPSELFGAKIAPPETVKSLLKSMEEFQKENEQLTSKLSSIPEEWRRRLASKDPTDKGAIGARVLLSRDLSQMGAALEEIIKQALVKEPRKTSADDQTE